MKESLIARERTVIQTVAAESMRHALSGRKDKGDGNRLRGYLISVGETKKSKRRFGMAGPRPDRHSGYPNRLIADG